MIAGAAPRLTTTAGDSPLDNWRASLRYSNAAIDIPSPYDSTIAAICPQDFSSRKAASPLRPTSVQTAFTLPWRNWTVRPGDGRRSVHRDPTMDARPAASAPTL
jgi:hypothetical protein